MKKILSIMLLLVLAFSLTACGSKTLVATREEDDLKGRIEVKFNSDDEAESVKFIMEFEDKDDAEDAYEELEEALKDYEDLLDDDDDLGIKTKHSGKKITLELDPSATFCYYMLGIDDDSSFEDVEEMLEDDDWDIK